MTDITFRAPDLFDTAAMISVEDEAYVTPGAAEHLAARKRFALWLTSQIIGKGHAARAQTIDKSAWVILVAPSGGGHVYITVGSAGCNESWFSLGVLELGGATVSVGLDIEDVLRNSSEITDLKIVR